MGENIKYPTLNIFPLAASSVIRIKTSQILPNPSQPRRKFSDRALDALADSVRRHGILEPLIVRRIGEHYELIAGERRLRAASRAGLDTVPCIIREASDTDSAELAIIENLQREDLDMFEEAEAIRSLISVCSLTQEAAASHLSCSQSYVANKLRLLKLTSEQRSAILEGGLSERHARALLRIRDDGERSAVLAELVRRKMNVAAAEEYIESYICGKERKAASRRAEQMSSEIKRKILSRDLRLFYNSIDRAVESVRNSGIEIEESRTESDGKAVIEITVTAECFT